MDREDPSLGTPLGTQQQPQTQTETQTPAPAGPVTTKSRASPLPTGSGSNKPAISIPSSPPSQQDDAITTTTAAARDNIDTSRDTSTAGSEARSTSPSTSTTRRTGTATSASTAAPRQSPPGTPTPTIHRGWELSGVSTAKCDLCHKQRCGAIQKCCECKLSVCKPCSVAGRLDSDTKHALDPDAVSWVVPAVTRRRKRAGPYKYRIDDDSIHHQSQHRNQHQNQHQNPSQSELLQLHHDQQPQLLNSRLNHGVRYRTGFRARTRSSAAALHARARAHAHAYAHAHTHAAAEGGGGLTGGTSGGGPPRWMPGEFVLNFQDHPSDPNPSAMPATPAQSTVPMIAETRPSFPHDHPRLLEPRFDIGPESPYHRGPVPSPPPSQPSILPLPQPQHRQQYRHNLTRPRSLTIPSSKLPGYSAWPDDHIPAFLHDDDQTLSPFAYTDHGSLIRDDHWNDNHDNSNDNIALRRRSDGLALSMLNAPRSHFPSPPHDRKNHHARQGGRGQAPTLRQTQSQGDMRLEAWQRYRDLDPNSEAHHDMVPHWLSDEALTRDQGVGEESLAERYQRLAIRSFEHVDTV